MKVSLFRSHEREISQTVGSAKGKVGSTSADGARGGDSLRGAISGDSKLGLAPAGLSWYLLSLGFFLVSELLYL